MADEAKPDRSAAFAAKASDLDALRAAVIDAAGVGAGLWISYLFVLLYMLVAAGAVTHRDLLIESPIKLPFLSVELPLVGFFMLGPLLFLVLHAYVLLHFALLANKVGVFHAELAAQIADDEVRASLRRQLPSNIFVQYLAGPREMRTGIMGFMLRLIAQISLVAAPLALLVFIQLQFLPYHSEAVVWWQRLAVLMDLALLWILWPSIARGETASISWRDFRRIPVIASAAASVALLLLVFTVATFPGERLDKNPLTLRFIPGRDLDGSPRWVSPHEFLLGGEVDLIARKPTSLWSNRLVLPGLDLIDHGKFDSDAKINAASETFSLRGRRLEGAILIGAKLRKVDFSAAQLTGAVLNRADLRGARFECAARKLPVKIDLLGEDDPAEGEQGESLCSLLDGAKLISAQLQGASFKEARLPGANFSFAQLQGAVLDDTKLQGASLQNALLHGATLNRAQLQGALLFKAQLHGASLDSAELQGARLDFAMLQAATLNGTNLQGAVLKSVQLGGATLNGVSVWRAAPQFGGGSARVSEPNTELQVRCARHRPEPSCDPSTKQYDDLKELIKDQVPLGAFRKRALTWIATLDPAEERPETGEAWTRLARAPLDTSAYEEGLRTAGCDPDGAPYVIRRLLPALTDRFEPNSPRPAALAAEFLDEAKCPGAKGLTEEEKAKLRQISGRLPAESAGAADATSKQ